MHKTWQMTFCVSPLYFRYIGITESWAPLAASLEMMLLLLWRHIAYYCESRHINNPDMKVSTAAVLRSVPQLNDGAVFRQDAAKRLPHVLNRLLQLSLVSAQLTPVEPIVTSLLNRIINGVRTRHTSRSCRGESAKSLAYK